MDVKRLETLSGTTVLRVAATGKRLGKKKRERKREEENGVKREERDVTEGRGLGKKNRRAGKAHHI